MWTIIILSVLDDESIGLRILMMLLKSALLAKVEKQDGKK